MINSARVWLLIGVAALLTTGAGGAQERPADPISGRLSSAGAPDELRLRDGTRLQGRTVSVDDTTVVFRSSAGTRVYNRGDVALLIFGGAPVSTGSLPAGISAGESYRVASWHTLRRITNFGREDAKSIPELRLSTDGSRIGFNSQMGLYTMNADGTNLTRVTDVRAEYWDMTADARRLVWYERSKGLFVVNGDGTGSQKLPGEIPPLALRVTARGDRAILVGNGAVWSINTDGSDIKQMTSAKAIAKAHGTVEENPTFFGYHGLEVSHDGARALVRYGWDLFAVDPTGVRRVTEFKAYALSSFDLSPDGSRIAWLDVTEPVEQKRKIEVTDWNGSGRRAIGHPASMVGAVQVINDGTVMGYLWESQGVALRLHHPDGGVHDLAYTGRGAAQPGMGNASISSDGRRIAFTTAGPLATEQGRSSQVWICDVKPVSVEGHPNLTNIAAFPRFLLNDGSTRSVVSLDSSDRDPMHGGAFLYAKNVIHDFRYDDYNPYLRDDGRFGDEKAADGRFSHGALQVGKIPRELEPGPVMLRVWMRSKDDRMLVVDLEGMELRRP